MRKLLILASFWFALFAGKTNDEVRLLVNSGKLADAFILSEQRTTDGDPEGDQALAWFYDEGKHVAQDKAKAEFHYNKCADAGLKHCQWRLGVMLDTGDGIPADASKAYGWFTMSAAQQYGRAHASLGLMHAIGRGTKVNFEKAMQSYREAASLGEPHGFYGVGVLHNLGQGVPKDKLNAFAWFMVAHFQGEEQAQTAMNNVSRDFSERQLKRGVEMATEIQREFGQ